MTRFLRPDRRFAVSFATMGSSFSATEPIQEAAELVGSSCLQLVLPPEINFFAGIYVFDYASEQKSDCPGCSSDAGALSGACGL